MTRAPEVREPRPQWYDFFVTGLAQPQIEEALRQRRVMKVAEGEQWW